MISLLKSETTHLSAQQQPTYSALFKNRKKTTSDKQTYRHFCGKNMCELTALKEKKNTEPADIAQY
jgi:hypothetical protein